MRLNLDFSKLNAISEDGLDEAKQRKRIVQYLYQLTEQLRYWQYHLEEENFSEEFRGEWEQTKNGIAELRVEADRIIAGLDDGGGSIAELLIAIGQIGARVQDAEGNIASLELRAGNLSSRVQDAEGNISTLNQTAASYGTRITNAEGDISTLEQTAASFGTRITNAEGDISTLEQTAASYGTRITNAEGSISTLNQTASSFGTRITNAEGSISTLTQTAEGLSSTVARVAQRTGGGRNYIRNSAGNRGDTSGWNVTNGALTQGTVQANVGSITTISSYANPFDLNKSSLKLVTTDADSACYISSASMAGQVTETGDFTWRARFFITQTDRNKLGASPDGARISIWVQYYDGTAVTEVEGSRVNLYKADLAGGWNTAEKTFTMPAEAVSADNQYLRLYIYLSAGGAERLVVTNTQLEKGAVPGDWHPAVEDGEAELAAAWTEIIQTADEVGTAASRIETITDGTDYATRLKNSSALLTPDDWRVAFNGNTALRLTESTADFNVETLNVKGGIVGDVVNTQEQDSYTVTADNAVMADLQAWVNDLGKYLTGTVTITIKAPISGTLVLRGFKSRGYATSANAGRIAIVFENTGRIWGSLNIYQCDSVVITGKGSDTVADIVPETGAVGLGIYQSGYVQVTDLMVDMTSSTSSSAKNCFRVDEGSRAMFVSCRALGGAYGWFVTNCSTAAVNNCAGGQGSGPYKFSQRAVLSRYGSVVHVFGDKRPTGSNGDNDGTGTMNTQGTSVQTAAATDGSSLPYDPGSAANTVVTVGPAETSQGGSIGGTIVSTDSSAISTDGSKVVKHTSDTDGTVRSGRNGSEYSFGIFYFGSGISSVSNKANITAATVRLTRAATEGGNTSRTVNLYWYGSNVSGPSSSDTAGAYFKNGSETRLAASGIQIRKGKSRTVQLTGTALAALKNGSLRGFGVGGSSEMELTGCDLNMIW